MCWFAGEVSAAVAARRSSAVDCLCCEARLVSAWSARWLEAETCRWFSTSLTVYWCIECLSKISATVIASLLHPLILFSEAAFYDVELRLLLTDHYMHIWHKQLSYTPQSTYSVINVQFIHCVSKHCTIFISHNSYKNITKVNEDYYNIGEGMLVKSL